jgi:hypothetical protein
VVFLKYIFFLVCFMCEGLLLSYFRMSSISGIDDSAYYLITEMNKMLPRCRKTCVLKLFNGYYSLYSVSLIITALAVKICAYNKLFMPMFKLTGEAV